MFGYHNPTQVEPKIDHRFKSMYTGLSFIENDMIFLKQGAEVAPEKLDISGLGTGITTNKWLASKGNYADFESFEHSFNRWINNLGTGWFAHNSTENFSINDDFRRVLTFAGVDEKLSRHNEISETGGAYSSLARDGDSSREITYSYKLDTHVLVEYMNHDYHNPEHIPENIIEDVEYIDDSINMLNVTKFIRWQLNRYFEVMKQDVWNKYAGSRIDFISTEFNDVMQTNRNYGIMFFFEHGKNEKYIIDNFPPTTYQEKYNDSSTSTYSKSDDSSLDVQKAGVYDVFEWDSEAVFDRIRGAQSNPPDVFDDTNSIDPLGAENTSLWYAPFDIAEISFTNYGGDEFVDITVKIPEGIAYNNEAKIINIATKGATDTLGGLRYNFNETTIDFKTHQIDGLYHLGVPKDHIANLYIRPGGKFEETPDGKTLTIIGSDTWFDKNKFINGQKQDTSSLGKNDVPFLIGTDLMYQYKAICNLDNTREYITPSLFHKKIRSAGIGSLNRIKYRGTGIGFTLRKDTTTLGTTVDRIIQPPPINLPLKWFEIHGGYDNTGPYSNVILGGAPGGTGYGGINLTTAHNSGVGYGCGFQVDNNKLTIRLNLLGWAVNDQGQYVPNLPYVHYSGTYRYKVKLEWHRTNGSYTTWFDQNLFNHDTSHDWDLAYKGTWLRTALNSQMLLSNITVPDDADKIRVTIYGEDATQVSSAEYDVTGYRPPTVITEKVPLSIDMTEYDINVGIVLREVRHL